MTPEELARQAIDKQLEACGWSDQDFADMNISAAPGVAIREFPLTTGAADYLLYADCEAVGVIEAKPEGFPLTGVETRSGKDKSIEESDDVPDPEVLVQAIADDPQTALEQFQAIAEKLKG